MVVSRGEKKLRPMVRTSVPACRIVASGFALFAVPGSLSFAYCPRSSLKIRGERELASDPLKVSVFTIESPVCSNEFCVPPFSNPWPVKSCRL